MAYDPKPTAMARLKAQRQREDDLVAAAVKAQTSVQKADAQLVDARGDYDAAVVELRDAMGLARTAEVLGESEGTVRRKKASKPAPETAAPRGSPDAHG